ncbi:MAG: hypothetical protein HUJ51_02480 [Eggerthellaceae bacterium]|nr:hypothetical protein [Eggerthellaceae bacterium]
MDTHSIGDSLSSVSNNIEVIASALQQSVYVIILFLKVIIMNKKMMLINLALASIAVIVASLLHFVTVIIVKKAGNLFKSRQTIMNELNGFVEKTYEGYKVINASNRKQKATGIINKIMARHYNNSRLASFAASELMPIIISLANATYTIMMLISGFMVTSGQYSIGIIHNFRNTCASLSNRLSTWHRFKTSFSRPVQRLRMFLSLSTYKKKSPTRPIAWCPRTSRVSLNLSMLSFVIASPLF